MFARADLNRNSLSQRATDNTNTNQTQQERRHPKPSETLPVVEQGGHVGSPTYHVKTAELYEAEFMGASEFLNRRVNEELQRAFEAGVPSSHVYPSPKVYHIGTPSERTTSEGLRSAVSQRTPSVQSHPTSSPISFGPSTPVQSASAAPEGLLSSPGGMSDVGSTLTPPGLSLRDPPRMAGSYGVPLNDPVFGISSGSIPCEDPGHRPIPQHHHRLQGVQE